MQTETTLTLEQFKAMCRRSVKHALRQARLGNDQNLANYKENMLDLAACWMVAYHHGSF